MAGIPLHAVAEARAALEQILARLAARKRRAGDLAVMRAAIEEQEIASNRDEDIAAEQHFHGAILEAARNPVLSALREVVSLYFERVRIPVRRKDRSRRDARTLRQHRAIYEAIRDRRSDEAAQLIHRHLAPTIKPPSATSRSSRKGE